jgi:hypothetical protein
MPQRLKLPVGSNTAKQHSNRPKQMSQMELPFHRVLALQQHEVCTCTAQAFRKAEKLNHKPYV